ncbi:MAG TPA: efflux RND transporter periplasmic adaptor subunit [Bryobacterales bacterium]|nr:efflux RND transporter periplasmic adaptor subunit [Bryobacterales bacterium]
MTVASVVQRDVPVDVQVIGNVEAYSTVTIKAQVTGQLTKVYFQEGEYVKKGELLFEIDPRPLQGMVNQAEATVAQNQAQLGQAQSNLRRDMAQEKYLQAQAERYARLFQEGIVSKDQSEQLAANADAVSQSVAADRAAVQSAQAAVGASRAAVANAKLQLSYTTIRSPIDGRAGYLMVKEGNLITSSMTDLITINQVQPIFVTFAVPEDQLAAIKQYMAQGKLPVSAIPQDGASAPETGELTLVDNTVDLTTGTIKLKATFANPQHRLWPGQFIRVVLTLTTEPNALVVPTQAVQTGQEGPFVYVVKKDRTVESRPVVTGAQVGQEMVVQKGLAPGETVVTEGHLRLAPGMRVQIRKSEEAARSSKGA